MRNDILKELLSENRHMVEVEKWRYGGNVIRFSDKALPFDSPVIGNIGAGEKYFNSGGRSVLVEDNNNAYKLKGTDPCGNIMASYWAQKYKEYENNRKEFEFQIQVDDALWTAYLVSEGKYSVLEDGKIGKHNGDPFGVLSFKKSNNEKEVLKIIEDESVKGEYMPAQIPAAIYEFNNLDFNSEKTTSFLTELPLSIGSDLRLSELNTFIRKKYESFNKQEKHSKEKDIRKLYEKIYGWIGYDARILSDSKLLPTPASSVSSNFSISYKNKKKEIGVSRVDHTSTRIGIEVGAKTSKSHLFWSSAKIVDCQNPLLLKEDNRIMFTIKKIGALRDFKKNFDKGWKGEVEPLNDYAEDVLFN